MKRPPDFLWALGHEKQVGETSGRSRPGFRPRNRNLESTSEYRNRRKERGNPFGKAGKAAAKKRRPHRNNHAAAPVFRGERPQSSRGAGSRLAQNLNPIGSRLTGTERRRAMEGDTPIGRPGSRPRNPEGRERRGRWQQGQRAGHHAHGRIAQMTLTKEVDATLLVVEKRQTFRGGVSLDISGHPTVLS